MLLVLVFGLWLGWRVNKAREQREAVAAVAKYGGWVHYDHEFVNGKLTPGGKPWAPRWLRRRIGDEFFQEVRQASLVYDDSTGKRYDATNVKACDDVLARVSGLPGLKVLMLKETQATDEGLRQVGAMKGLEELFVWDAVSVTDAGVAHLAGLGRLKNVHISKSKITDESLAVLSGLPRMEKLSLQNNHFSDAGLARLKGKGRLKMLAIGLGDFRVTDAGVAALRGCEALEVLDLQGSNVTDQGLEHLRGLTKLKALWLSGTGVTDKGIERLRKAMPALKANR
jgi:hypothetical protein